MAGNRYTPEQIAAALRQYQEWHESPWSPEKPGIEEFARDVVGVSKPTLYKWVREARIRKELNGHGAGGSVLPDATVTKFVTDLAANEARIKSLERTVREMGKRLAALEHPDDYNELAARAVAKKLSGNGTPAAGRSTPRKR